MKTMMKSQTTKRKANKLISLLLSVVFAFSLFPLTAFALEGDGSAETPYEIGTADELMEFAQKVNDGETGAYAVLTADIDLSGKEWTGIATGNPYTGVFDGKGFSIKNLTGSEGLFKYNNGIIKNVQLVDVSIEREGGNLGAVAGKNDGTVFNCVSSGSITGTGSDAWSVGGLIGHNNGGTLSGSASSCTVDGRTAGGLVGSNWHSGSHNYGAITACIYTGIAANPVEGDSHYSNSTDVYYKDENGVWKSYPGNVAADETALLQKVNAYIAKNGGTFILSGDGTTYPTSAVSYLDHTENGFVTKYAETYTEINSENLPTTWNDGWYVVGGTVAIDSRVTVTGDVKLILKDGANLIVNGGFSVPSGSAFTVYGQQDGTGNLTSNGTNGTAGIGGTADNVNFGTIVLAAKGKITATGDIRAAGIGAGAGIGGSYNASGGSITITGGFVEAGSIGGGSAENGGPGGTIIISGGIVTADRIGAGGDNQEGSFSTTSQGNAVIFAGSISDQSGKNTNAWSGLIFEGNDGKIYGTGYTVDEDLTIPADKTLTIESGKTLTVADGVTLTNNGAIHVNHGGTYSGAHPSGNEVMYQIDWDTDGDGTVDDTTYVAYGAMPAHADGSKESDPQYTYTFTGWSPELAVVTGTAKYTAVFDSSLNQYTVTLPSGEGFTVHHEGSTAVEYGKTFTFTVSVEKGYFAGENFAVKAYGKSLTPNANGSYTVTVSGNVTITVKGIEQDAVMPVISGVTDGGTYYVTQSVTVTDDHLQSVTLNGVPVTDSTFTLEGNKSETYTIVAIDQAGNKTSCTVTMKPVSTLAQPIEGLTLDNVTSADKADIEAVKAQVAAVDTASATEAEKAALREITDTCDTLLERLEQASQAVNNETINKAEGITPDTVKPEDKDDLLAAKEELEEALENFGDNYTEEEKGALEEKLEQINSALDSIEKAEAAQDVITALPDTVEPDDTDTEALINAAKEQYDALTEHEKSMVSEQMKQKLEVLIADLTDYRVVDGNGGRWTVGSGESLTFTANGAAAKFIGLMVDGVAVDADHYTVRAGSTIVTLKAEYLNALSAGKHTLTILYADGEATGEFVILAQNTDGGDTENETTENGPVTGDSTASAALWCVFAFAGVLAVLCYGIKKQYNR